VTPTHLITDTGDVIPLTADPTGWHAKHDDMTVYVSVLRNSPVTTSPAKWRP
jgi:hypothetical protein